jgi:hypothetical protein
LAAINGPAAGVRAIVCSPVASEALTFEGVQQVFYMAPHWNEYEFVQVCGRVARRGAHRHIPDPSQRRVVAWRLVARPCGSVGGGGGVGGFHTHWPFGSVDEHIERVAAQKNEVAKEALGRVRALGAHTAGLGIGAREGEECGAMVTVGGAVAVGHEQDRWLMGVLRPGRQLRFGFDGFPIPGPAPFPAPRWSWSWSWSGSGSGSVPGITMNPDVAARAAAIGGDEDCEWTRAWTAVWDWACATAEMDGTGRPPRCTLRAESGQSRCPGPLLATVCAGLDFDSAHVRILADCARAPPGTWCAYHRVHFGTPPTPVGLLDGVDEGGAARAFFGGGGGKLAAIPTEGDEKRWLDGGWSHALLGNGEALRACAEELEKVRAGALDATAAAAAAASRCRQWLVESGETRNLFVWDLRLSVAATGKRTRPRGRRAMTLATAQLAEGYRDAVQLAQRDGTLGRMGWGQAQLEAGAGKCGLIAAWAVLRLCVVSGTNTTSSRNI